MFTFLRGKIFRYSGCVDFKKPPIKRSVLCTNHYGIRLDDETYERLRGLDTHGIDTPDWVRSVLREALQRQLAELSPASTQEKAVTRQSR